MSRYRLNRQNSRVEIQMTRDDKEAFEKWCRVNGMTISEVIRSEISHLVKEGYSLT
jgi:Ribbon-helix-helix protein, copG family